MKHLLNKLFPDHYHIQCGLHSGFPSCCILFFCWIWIPFISSTKYYGKLWHRLSNNACKKRGLGTTIPAYCQELDKTIDIVYPYFGRIVCPFCLFFSKRTGSIKCDCCYGKLGDIIK